MGHTHIRTIKQMYYTRLVSTTPGIDYYWTANCIKHLTIYNN